MTKRILLAWIAISFFQFSFAQELPCNGQPGKIHPNGGGFVADSAKVSGSVEIDSNSEVCDNAVIEGGEVSLTDSKVAGSAILKGIISLNDKALIEGNAYIFNSGSGNETCLIGGSVHIYGHAKIECAGNISLNSKIYGGVNLRGEFSILNSQIYGRAKILDQAQIIDSKVHGLAQVSGKARVIKISRNTEVCDNVVISGDKVVQDTLEYCKSVPDRAELGVFPNSFTFKNTPVGSLSNSELFSFFNSGGADASGCNNPVLVGENPTEFEIIYNGCFSDTMISGGGACVVNVVAKPTSIGTKSATLTRVCTVGGSVSTIQEGLSYLATESNSFEITPKKARLNDTSFGTLSNNEITFKIRNTGTVEVGNCAAPKITGDNSSEFKIVSDTCGTNDLPLFSGEEFTYSFGNPLNYNLSNNLYIQIIDESVQLKKGFIPDNLFYASYDTGINGDLGVGSLTGTAFGGASVSNGALDLSFGDVRYVDYENAGNANFDNVGAVRIEFTPNYNGAPPESQVLLKIFDSTPTDKSRLQLIHNGDGNLRIYITDDSSNIIVDHLFGVFSATSGQTYELEFNVNGIDGQTKLFVDGVEFGVPNTTVFTNRVGANTDTIRVGSNETATRNSYFKINRFAIFNSIQHTSNYTPVPNWLEYKTNEEYVELTNGINFSSNFEYFKANTSIPSGDQVRFNVSIDDGLSWLWWNGSQWAPSNGTILEASSSNIVSAKIKELGSTGVFKFKAFLKSGTGLTTPSLLNVTFGNILGECTVKLAGNPSSIGEKTATLERLCSGNLATTDVNGISYTAIGPRLSFSPLEYSFGSFNVGSFSQEKTFTFRNDLNTDAKLCSPPVIIGANPEDFQIVADDCSSLKTAPGGTCSVSIRAIPSLAGTRSATLARNCGVGGLATTESNGLSVFGLSTTPLISASPVDVDFGDLTLEVVSNTQEIIFSNTGEADATGCSAPQIQGLDSSSFEIVSDSCGTNDLVASIGQCSVVLRANVNSPGSKIAELSRSCSVGGETLVSLSVNANILAPAPSLEINPLAFNFGNAPLGIPYNFNTFIFSNIGAGDATQCSRPYLIGSDFNSFSITRDTCSNLDLQSGQSCEVDVAVFGQRLGLVKSTLVRNCIFGGAVKTFRDSITAEVIPNEPILSVDPNSFNYGEILLGENSTQVFNFINSGFGTATGCSAPFGTGDNSFQIINDNCGTSDLNSLQGCDVTVRFSPLISGPKSFSLSRNCTSGGLATVNIEGQGVEANLHINPTSPYSFSDQIVSTQSAPARFTITNTGTGNAYNCSTPNLSGLNSTDFTITPVNCPSTLIANGGTCEFDIVFSPNLRGNREASIDFSCLTGGSLNSNISGIGLGAILALDNGTEIDLGAVPNTRQSDPKVVTFNVSGDVEGQGCSDFLISGADGAEFEIVPSSDSCGNVLALGENCSVEIFSNTQSLGQKNATLEKNCTQGGSFSFDITANSLEPVIASNPINVDFGDIFLGGYSSSVSVNFTNTSLVSAFDCNVPTFSGPNSSNFQIINSVGCVGELSPSQSCSVEVRANAQALGAFSGSLDFNCLYGGQTKSTLSGNGVPIVATMPISPTQKNFEEVGINNTSLTSVFRVFNSGEGVATGCSAPSLTGDNLDFKIVSTTCTQSMEPGGVCEIFILASPSNLGSKTAKLTRECITGGIASAKLSVEGINSVNQLSFNENSYNFGYVEENGLSIIKVFNLSNTIGGDATGCSQANLVGPQASEFEIISESCGSVIQAKSTCHISIVSAPGSVGAKIATLQKTCTNGGSALVGLLAKGTSETQKLSSSPSSLNFNRVVANNTSKTYEITFSNLGKGLARGCSVNLSDSLNFKITSNNCDTDLAANSGSCRVGVLSHPTSNSEFNASVSLNCQKGGSLSVPLIVEGISGPSQITFNKEEINLGDVPQNQTSKVTKLTIFNNGDGPAQGCGFPSLGSSQFKILNQTCGSEILSNQTCDIDVVGAPNTLGEISSTITLDCIKGGQTISNLRMKSVSGDNYASFNSHKISFDRTPATQATNIKEVVFTNSGIGPILDCSDPVITSGNSNFFIKANTCTNSSMSAGESCVVSVFSSSITQGDFSGTLERSCLNGGSAQVELSSSFTNSAPSLITQTQSISFYKTPVGNNSEVKVITFFNNSKGIVSNCSQETLSAPDSADFDVISNSCVNNEIEPGESCQLVTLFSPSTEGSKNSILSQSCQFGGTASISLYGDGNATESTISVSPKEFNFSKIPQNGVSKPISFKVTNKGRGPAESCSYSINSGWLSINNELSTCSSSISPNSTCEVFVNGHPQGLGDVNANLSASCLKGGSSQSGLRISGTSSENFLKAHPSAMNFSSVEVGTASPKRIISVANYEDFEVKNCTNPSLTGPNSLEFLIEMNGLDNPCNDQTSLKPGESCQIGLISTPVDSLGDRIANLEFSCNSSSNVNVQLFARGVFPNKKLYFVNPSLLSFDNNIDSKDAFVYGFLPKIFKNDFLRLEPENCNQNDPTIPCRVTVGILDSAKSRSLTSILPLEKSSGYPAISILINSQDDLTRKRGRIIKHNVFGKIQCDLFGNGTAKCNNEIVNKEIEGEFIVDMTFVDKEIEKLICFENINNNQLCIDF